ncbi:MAG: TatD family hydrolase [Bacteroidota bacterium]
MSIPFVNIHTHFKPNNTQQQVVRNAYVQHVKQALPSVDYLISVGLHPWHLHALTEKACNDVLIEHAAHEKVWAIGEIGLDRAISTPLSIQTKYFELQLNIARAVKKPVIIHSVRSYNDFIPYLKKVPIPFIFHGFNGNIQQAKDLLKHGAYLSFGAAVTKEQYSQVIQSVPMQQLFLETDQSLIQIDAIYRRAAEILQVQTDELKLQLFNNFAGLK